MACIFNAAESGRHGREKIRDPRSRGYAFHVDARSDGTEAEGAKREGIFRD